MPHGAHELLPHQCVRQCCQVRVSPWALLPITSGCVIRGLSAAGRHHKSNHTHAACHCRGIVQPNKMISYLVDLQTIRVLDLLSGATAASISHDARVDWLVSIGPAWHTVSIPSMKPCCARQQRMVCPPGYCTMRCQLQLLERPTSSLHSDASHLWCQRRCWPPLLHQPPCVLKGAMPAIDAQLAARPPASLTPCALPAGA